MKNYENYIRARDKYVGFRLSEEEKARLDRYVKMSGMTFREYVARRVLQEDVVIVGNTKVYKALKSQMEEIVNELLRISNSENISEEFLKVTGFALTIYEGMKEKEKPDSKQVGDIQPKMFSDC